MTIIKLGHGLEIDLDIEVNESHSTKALLHLLVAMLKHQQKQLTDIRKNMIPQSVFDASLKALTDAVANIGNTGTPSTPDNIVQAFITGVDTNTQHILATGTTPPLPTP